MNSKLLSKTRRGKMKVRQLDSHSSASAGRTMHSSMGNPLCCDGFSSARLGGLVRGELIAARFESVFEKVVSNRR